MIRLLVCLVPLCLSFPAILAADPRQDQISQALTMQNALKRGREAMQRNQPLEAMSILEEHILLANGQTDYLELLRDAYRAGVRELELKRAGAEQIDHIRRQLRTLELSVGEKTRRDELPKNTTEKQQEIPISQVKPPASTPTPAPASKPGRAETEKLFKARQYAEAAIQYANRSGDGTLDADEKTCWAYCRLHAVAEKCKAGEAKYDAELKLEIEAAYQLGGLSVKAFAESLLQELATPRTPAVPDTFGTIAVNFRITSKTPGMKTDEVLKYAEQQRRLALERWTGTRGADWKIPCEIVLHESAESYARATGKARTLPGHSTVNFDGGKVSSRRIDLRLDSAEMFESQLPKEIHYVVISELFADEPLPAWAEFGMAALAEPASHRSRNRRMMARLLDEKKSLKIDRVLETATAPADSTITPYYLEGVTLIDYLSRLQGPRTLSVFLQEAPRRGWEKSLSQHYGIKSLPELEKKWQADLVRGE